MCTPRILRLAIHLAAGIGLVALLPGCTSNPVSTITSPDQGVSASLAKQAAVSDEAASGEKQNGAIVSKEDLSDYVCMDRGTGISICIDIQGTVRSVLTPSGNSRNTLDYVKTTTYAMDGVTYYTVKDSRKSVQFLKDGDQQIARVSTSTIGDYNDGEECFTTTYVVDYFYVNGKILKNEKVRTMEWCQ